MDFGCRVVAFDGDVVGHAVVKGFFLVRVWVRVWL